jgi:Ca2+-binding RTX toxin-like protein
MPQTVLFNGASGGLPPTQGWLSFGTNPLLPSSQFQRNGLTNLVSKPGGLGGYSNYRPMTPTLVNAAFPSLQRSIGFALNFQVRVNSESHTASDINNDGLADRAGFSITALSSDRLGIELGFWSNEVWAQLGGNSTTLFTHSSTERAALSTGSLVSYKLLVLENTYILTANQKLVLAGPLKDYSAFDYVAAKVPYNPYTTPNFLFFGDNTKSGDANIDIALIAATTPTLGSSSNDSLNGTSSDDLINGLAGNDSLNGLGGNDILIGSTGNDALSGGEGNDILTGGDGADRFLFSSRAAFTSASLGIDNLIDFQPNRDRVVLSKTTFPALTSAVGAGLTDRSDFALVSTDAAAASSTARLAYNTFTGSLFYNPNGTAAGFGTGGQFAWLGGQSSGTAPSLLSSSSFELVA